jgi:hypothetical protein
MSSQYTRDDLKNLCTIEQQQIRKNSINKITAHLSENIIKKARQGETLFIEYFPKNKFSDLQDDVIKNLSSIFPDSEIKINEKIIDSMKCIEFTIDWEIQDV